MFRHCSVILRQLVINYCQVTQVFQMQLLVMQFTIMMFHGGFMQRQIFHCITNSCILNTCVTWQGIDYKLSEDDMIVSKHVGV